MVHHYRVIHEGKKDYKCDTCGKRFTHPRTLRKHIEKTFHFELGFNLRQFKKRRDRFEIIL